MTTTKEVSQGHDEKARKFASLLLQRLASVGQRAAAEALGVHESTISRIKENELERYCQLVSSLGLKVVPADMKCYRPADIDPYIQLAKQHMTTLHSAEQLVWED